MSTQDQSARTNAEQPTQTGSQTDVSDSAPQQDDGVTEAEQEPESLSLDLVFEILKNSRRREVIHYLRDHEDDERVSLGELAEHVAAIENDTTTDQLTSSQRKRVYVGLYQCHLPKMDDMGVVDFNQDRGHVALAPQADCLTEYLDRPTDDEGVQWHRYYGAISAVGVAIVGLSLGLGLGSALATGLLGLVVATFAFCSACHWVTESRDED
ncbi:DUF7344 domain-containing protein [Haloarcula onubensis]|uniref:DUF7344 domain-containing protein n=1 Tax=Haloarcula onubensis TaxID=2950539 RepID=A0ABU2FNB5_9EURY|nr:hypothetical protein [Halomicroarcula sp. S3CR25-11]MDS0281792.1 hypothetical protein [Halomicroarcula sp. S3CR25-11]